MDRRAARRRIIATVALLTAACAEPARDDGAAPSLTADDTAAATARTHAPSSNVCSPTPRNDDRMLCLPERAGPLRPAVSRAELETLFGSARIRDQPVNVGEGMMEPGTLVNIGQADSAQVVWSDSSRARIASVLALGPAWRTTDGLGVGSSLADIERALGPVQVLGFGWDYGGTILLDGTRLANSGLFFRLQPRAAATSSTEAYQRVRGDQPYASTDPDVRSLDLVVARVDVIWR